MPKSDSFLKTYFSDCQTEMRWRRDVEYKLINSLLPLCPALVAGLFVLTSFVEPHIILASSIGLSFFVVIMYYYVRKKVMAENSIYKSLGDSVVKIWEYFSLFDQKMYLPQGAILSEKSKNYGQGKGYKLTLNVFGSIAFITILMLLSIGLFSEYSSNMTSECSKIHNSEEALNLGLKIAKKSDPATKDWVVRSLDWFPNENKYVITLLRNANYSGYSISIDSNNRSISKIEIINDKSIPTK